MEPKLIKIDRNGSKHYEGIITCERCGGSGIYAHHVENGKVIPNWNFGGVCLKCNGSGKVISKWIERTPEYQAKLDAKRNARFEAEEAKREAERIAKEAEEARIKAEQEAALEAQKAVSQFVGNVGDKVQMNLTLVHSASFEAPSFSGFGTTLMYVHIMQDSNGNKFTWKTGSGLGIAVNNHWITVEDGQEFILKGTIKEHSEYKGEKQTVLTRCKVIKINK